MKKALGLRHKALGEPVAASCQPTAFRIGNKRPGTGDKRHNKQRGQALVELALVLPILLLILMAIVDMGRIYHGFLSVTTAAREGARQAALGRTDEQVRATAIVSATPLEADRITVSISPDIGLRYAGANIEVRVEYQMAIITPGMQAFFPNPYVVIGKAVMKRE